MEDDDDCLEVLPNPTPPHHATLASSHSHVCLCVCLCVRTRARASAQVWIRVSSLSSPANAILVGARRPSVLQHNPRRHRAALNRAVNAPDVD